MQILTCSITCQTRLILLWSWFAIPAPIACYFLPLCHFPAFAPGNVGDGAKRRCRSDGRHEVGHPLGASLASRPRTRLIGRPVGIGAQRGGPLSLAFHALSQPFHQIDDIRAILFFFRGLRAAGFSPGQPPNGAAHPLGWIKSCDQLQ